MAFSVNRLPNEPIIIVTLSPPTTQNDAQQITRTIMRSASDVDGTLYRVTDFRGVTMDINTIEQRIQGDINFTSWRTRSVVVGVGDTIQHLVNFTNQHYYQQFRVVAFPCLESALAHVRWEIKTDTSAYS